MDLVTQGRELSAAASSVTFFIAPKNEGKRFMADVEGKGRGRGWGAVPSSPRPPPLPPPWAGVVALLVGNRTFCNLKLPSYCRPSILPFTGGASGNDKPAYPFLNNLYRARRASKAFSYSFWVGQQNFCQEEKKRRTSREECLY